MGRVNCCRARALVVVMVWRRMKPCRCLPAPLGSAGCGELDVESARLRAARWIGTQPVGYGEVLSRWYLSDAADAMSAGRWGDAVYCSEKYLPVVDTKRQVA